MKVLGGIEYNLYNLNFDNLDFKQQIISIDIDILQTDVDRNVFRNLLIKISEYLTNDNQYKGIKVFIDDAEDLISYCNMEEEFKLLLNTLNDTEKVGFVIATQRIECVLLKKGDIILLKPYRTLLGYSQTEKSIDLLNKIKEHQRLFFGKCRFGMGTYIKKDYLENLQDMKDINEIEFIELVIDEELE